MTFSVQADGKPGVSPASIQAGNSAVAVPAAMK
jgi:hypothetical protein